MQWILAGLGNPGAQYTGSRHNTGRDLLQAIAKKEGIKEWKEDKKLRALTAKAEVFGKKAILLLPETYMNNSGAAFHALVGSKKQAQLLVVLQDELDLPLGVVKLSFGSSSGGHRGIESVQKAIKTKDFVRVRIGISPSTASGKLKKPDSKQIVDFVLGKFKPGEQDKLKRAKKIVEEALELLVNDGLARAMTETNSR